MQYYHERYPDKSSAIQLYIADPDSDLPQLGKNDFCFCGSGTK